MEATREEKLKLHEEIAQQIEKHQQKIQQMNLDYKQVVNADQEKLQEIKISKQLKGAITIQKVWKGNKLRRNLPVLREQNIKIKAAIVIQRARERGLQKKEIAKFYDENAKLIPNLDVYKTLTNAEYIYNMSPKSTG
jgi:hypothetical protein